MKFSMLKSEIRITLIVFLAGVCWIVFSDKILYQLVGSHLSEHFHYVEITKGIVFVTLMSIGVLLLLRKHDKSLQDSLNKYMGLFQDNPNAMWIYDATTLQFLAVNDAAIAKYGYTREEFLNMTIEEISIDDKADKHIVNETSDSKIFFDTGVWKIKRKDASTLYVRQLSHSLMYNKRKCNLTLTEDLTNLIKQGEKLRNIAFKNSHELRKPVANILGLISILEMNALSDENKQIIEYIEYSIKDLDATIKSIAEESADKI